MAKAALRGTRRNIWLDVPIPGGWTVSYRLIPGEPVQVGEVRIAPTGDGVPKGGLTADRWRSVAFWSLLGQGLAEATRATVDKRKAWDRMAAEHYGEARDDGFEHTPANVLSSLQIGKPSKQRHHGRTNREVAEIARDVIAAYARQSGRPNVEVGKKRGLRSTQIRDALQTAQARGIYAPIGHGRRGGVLTDYGQRVLRGEEA